MITVIQNLTAISIGNSTSFGAIDAVGAITWAVLPNGAGGTIDSNGVYSSPENLTSDDPRKWIDTVEVTDSEGTKATSKIMVLHPIGLLGDIIMKEMGLPQDQVSFYNQKFNITKDTKIYISVGELSAKPYANNINYDRTTGLEESVTTKFRSLAYVEVYGYSNLVFMRKGEAVSSLVSTYSEQQQEANSFKIGKIPQQFNNISKEDGPGIPYRFNITVAVSYSITKTKSVPYFDTFEDNEINTSI